MARAPQLNLTLFLLTACAGNKATRTADDDTGASGVDTDTSAPVAGCITLNGAGDFASLTEALSAAGEGDTIGLCAGDFEESARVEIPVLILGAGARAHHLSLQFRGKRASPRDKKSRSTVSSPILRSRSSSREDADGAASEGENAIAAFSRSWRFHL